MGLAPEMICFFRINWRKRRRTPLWISTSSGSSGVLF